MTPLGETQLAAILFFTLLTTDLHSQIASESEVEFGTDFQLAERKEIGAHLDNAYCVVFSRDGRLLSSGGKDKTVRVWGIKDAQALYALRGHTASVTTIAFSPDGKLIASGSRGFDRADGQMGEVMIWHVATGKQVHADIKHSGTFVESISFSPDAKHLLVAGCGRTIDDAQATVWKIEGDKLVSTPDDQSGCIVDAAFSPDGKSLATMSTDGTVKLWDWKTAREIRKFQVDSRLPLSATMMFASDGSKLFCFGSKCVRADLVTGESLEVRSESIHAPTRVPFYHRWVGNNGVFDSETFGRLSDFPSVPGQSVNAVAVNAAGKLVAAACSYRYDIPKGTEEVAGEEPKFVPPVRPGRIYLWQIREQIGQ